MKKAVRAVFMYLLLTAGVYMFLECCSNSYNRLSVEKTAPASIVVNGGNVAVSVLEKEMSFSTEFLYPDSDLYLIAYLLVPDEVRSMGYYISKQKLS